MRECWEGNLKSKFFAGAALGAVSLTLASAADAQVINPPVEQMMAAVKAEALRILQVSDPAFRPEMVDVTVTGIQVVGMQMPSYDLGNPTSNPVTVKYGTDTPTFAVACMEDRAASEVAYTHTTDNSSSVEVSTTNSIGVEASVGANLDFVTIGLSAGWSNAVTKGQTTTVGNSIKVTDPVPLPAAKAGTGHVIVPLIYSLDLTKQPYTATIKPSYVNITTRTTPVVKTTADLTHGPLASQVRTVTVSGTFDEGWLNVGGGARVDPMTPQQVAASCPNVPPGTLKPAAAPAMLPVTGALRATLPYQPGQVVARGVRVGR